jgi:imidazolonepropionase-like amidohydrolase
MLAFLRTGCSRSAKSRTTLSPRSACRAGRPATEVDSTQFSIEELNAIVEEATAANIYVAGHAYTSRAINRGLECGRRSIEHGNLMDESSIPLFKKHGAFYVPTIVTYQILARKALA